MFLFVPWLLELIINLHAKMKLVPLVQCFIDTGLLITAMIASSIFALSDLGKCTP